MFSSEMKTLASCADRIEEFPSGHYYHSEVGLQSDHQLPACRQFISDLDEVLPLIRNSLQKSVQKRMMADVPVGVFKWGIGFQPDCRIDETDHTTAAFIFRRLPPFP